MPDEGPTVVFVHGALVNANLWRHVVAALQPDCRCVALDLPLGSHLRAMPKEADLSPPPRFLPPIRNRTAKLMGLNKGAIEPPAAASYSLPALRDRGVRRDLKKAMAGMAPSFTEAAAERFPEFDRPVLIAWSREDKFFPAKHAERLAESFPEARLEWVEDAYTLSPEDQPQRLAELIGGFSARVASA